MVVSDEALAAGNERIKKAKRRVLFGVCGVTIAALLSLGILILSLLPFAPVTYTSYEPDRTTACPGTPVGFIVEREIEPNVQINDITIDAAWEAVDVPGFETGKMVSAGEFQPKGSTPDVEPGRDVVPSPYLRSAPGAPGEWRAITHPTIRGTSYGAPHVQREEIHSQSTLIVLDPSDPQCANN